MEAEEVVDLVEEKVEGIKVPPRFNLSREKMNTINIYVGNLSFDVTEAQLRQEFVAFGEVVSVTIMNDKYIGSGQPLGYGFVEMAAKRDGETAIASLHGRTLEGRALDVIEALPLTDKASKELLLKRKGRQLKRQRRERRY